MEEANREDKASDSLTKGKFEALDSQASFDRVLFDGGEFGTGGEVGSEDELDFLGIPGLLDAEQVGTLLRQRQHEQLNRKNRRAPAAEPAAAAPAIPDHRMLMDLRNELAKNVAAWSARTGTPHGVVHTKLRTVCGGLQWPRRTRNSFSPGCGSSRTGSSAGSSIHATSTPPSSISATASSRSSAMPAVSERMTVTE
ncbi:uncharacterized protein Rv2917/MT2985 [Arthrobacter sp. Hiyo4]|nr:uncharacterized protein Rv2917/MT2985 [Arthrobacter sp. Hiyo4]